MFAAKSYLRLVVGIYALPVVILPVLVVLFILFCWAAC